MNVKQQNIMQRLKSADHAFWAGVLFFCLVLLGIAVLSNKMVQKLMSAQDMPLSTLQISGTRPYSSDLEIQQALRQLSENESFFSLDVKRVQQKLEQLPWIDKVSVRRQWPNGLSIHVIDQEPVAYWNDEYLLNNNGDIFLAPQEKITVQLPRFYGPKHVPMAVLTGYRALLPLFVDEKLQLEQVILNKRESWKIILTNGSQLILGRGNDVIRNSRVERFLKVYKHVMPVDKQINYVDLRYDTGFAVNWKKTAGDKANNEQG